MEETAWELICRIQELLLYLVQKSKEETKRRRAGKRDEYSRAGKRKIIKQETSVRGNKQKKEMRISAEARPRQAVWNMTMAHMGNGTDQPPAEDKKKQMGSHVSNQAW